MQCYSYVPQTSQISNALEMALDLVKDYSYLGILYGATFSMNEIMQLCLLLCYAIN